MNTLSILTRSAFRLLVHSSTTSNERTLTSRGGAFMIERYTGTVNIVGSRFEENYSQTYGAGIYTRGNTLNVINTHFEDNVATGWVRKKLERLVQ